MAKGVKAVQSYAPHVDQVTRLINQGKSKPDAITEVASLNGLAEKSLRDACYRYGVAAGNQNSMGSLVRDARELLGLAEQACQEIDALKQEVRARDHRIESLERDLERRKEGSELAELQGRFRQTIKLVKSHLSYVGHPGS